MHFIKYEDCYCLQCFVELDLLHSDTTMDSVHHINDTLYTRPTQYNWGSGLIFLNSSKASTCHFYLNVPCYLILSYTVR